MPFLRFTRDKRGYETTALLHAGRRNGRSRQRILYWFRTPPGVKVGRPALDEDAIRWIEEHNPDIEFDWPKILEAQPPAAPPAEDSRVRRQRRDRDRPRPPKPPAPQTSDRTETHRPDPPPAEVSSHIPDAAEMARPQPHVEPSGLEPEPAPEREAPELEPEPGEHVSELREPSEPEVAQALEQLIHPEGEEKVDPPAMPVEQNLGREQLARLRARYAELLTRITERGGDPERIDALRAQAEPLNPDMWVTAEEVRQGVESFEPAIRDLRAALGLRRRRRSKRGGRRAKGEWAVEGEGSAEGEGKD